jgi:hypothetical protein
MFRAGRPAESGHPLIRVGHGGHALARLDGWENAGGGGVRYLGDVFDVLRRDPKEAACLGT